NREVVRPVRNELTVRTVVPWSLGVRRGPDIDSQDRMIPRTTDPPVVRAHLVDPLGPTTPSLDDLGWHEAYTRIERVHGIACRYAAHLFGAGGSLDKLRAGNTEVVVVVDLVHRLGAEDLEHLVDHDVAAGVGVLARELHRRDVGVAELAADREQHGRRVHLALV